MPIEVETYRMPERRFIRLSHLPFDALEAETSGELHQHINEVAPLLELMFKRNFANAAICNIKKESIEIMFEGPALSKTAHIDGSIFQKFSNEVMVKSPLLNAVDGNIMTNSMSPDILSLAP